MGEKLPLRSLLLLQRALVERNLKTHAPLLDLGSRRLPKWVSNAEASFHARGAGRPDHRITTERKASKAASSLCLCTAVRHVLMSMACAAGRTLANGSPRTAWPSAGSVSRPLGFLPLPAPGRAVQRRQTKEYDKDFRELRLQRCPCHSAHAEWGTAGPALVSMLIVSAAATRAYCVGCGAYRECGGKSLSKESSVEPNPVWSP